MNFEIKNLSTCLLRMPPRILPSPMGADPEEQLPFFVVGRNVKDFGEYERMLPRMLLINSPMGPGYEMIVPVDLDVSCNMVSSVWSK